jgi:HEAT repeat protein
MTLRKSALSTLGALAIASMSSCTTYTPDISLTSKIKTWNKESDNSKAQLDLRNATHRAATNNKLKLKHEADLLYALSTTKDDATKKFFLHELKLIGGSASIEPLGDLLNDKILGVDATMALLYIHNSITANDDSLFASSGAASSFIDALPSATGKNQLAIVKALGSIQKVNGSTIEQLEKLITSSTSQLRYAAIRSVANIADSDSSEVLLKAIKEEKSYRRSQVINWNYLFARNLAKSDMSDAETHVLTVLSNLDKNKDVHLYINGLSSLQNIKGNNFTSDLISYMADDNLRLAEAVSRFLEKSQDQTVNAKIIAAFPEARSSFQQLALKVIVTRGDSDSSNLVAQSLKSKDQDLRVAATILSNEVKATAVIPALIELISQGTKEDSQAASAALLRIPSDQSSNALRLAYEQADASAKVLLLNILATKSDSTNADLALNATLDTDKKISKAAFNTLKGIAEARQIPQLITLISKSTTSTQFKGYQTALVTASHGQSGETTELLLKTISSGASSKSNMALIQVLSRLGGKQAFSGLQGLYSKGSDAVQKEALRTLAKWGDIAQFSELLVIAAKASGSNKTLMTRGLSSLITNSSRSLEEKKKSLNQLKKIADSKEKERIEAILKKLK